MKKSRLIILVFLQVVFTSQFLFCQKPDSLKDIFYDVKKADSTRVIAILAHAWTFFNNEPDTGIVYAKIGLEYAIKTKQEKYEARANNIIGVCLMNKGDYAPSIDYFNRALALREKVNDKPGISSCLGNIALVYRYQSNYPKALDYSLRSLKIREEMKDTHMIAGAYNDVGNIYYLLRNYKLSLDNNMKSLNLRMLTGDKAGIAKSYNSIGSIYSELKEHDKALDYYLKAIGVRIETGDIRGLGNSYANLAGTYSDLGRHADAIKYYFKSKEIRSSMNDKRGVADTYEQLGQEYLRLKNYKLAIVYSDSGLKAGIELAVPDNIRYCYRTLSEAHANLGNYKQAYDFHVLFKTYTDSIFNEENSKQLGDLKTQFEVEKKEAELKIKADAEQEKLKALANEERKRQNVIIGAVAGVLFLVLMFSLFLLNRFRITRRQKKIIEQQKVMVDKAYDHLHEKNKEVMDSIFYARRIQQALLPTEKYISKNFRGLK
ncbi:MAG: tetratricopeptide repeat protein [Bacteroidia bacterium]